MLLKNLTLMLATAAVFLVVTGCTQSEESAEKEAPAAGQAGQTGQTAQTVGGQKPAPEKSEIDGPYHYTSDDGNFQVTWPGGCNQLRIRANEPEIFVGEEQNEVVLYYLVTCDRVGMTGEGCSVTATFDAKSADGGEATSEQVLVRVRHALNSYGVTVVRQVPLKREFENGVKVEGIDVFGVGRDGKSQFWVRGMLAFPDIYVLTAWSVKGDLWENPTYQDFFNDFLPFAE